MNKYTAVLLVVFAVFLVACTNDSSSNSTPLPLPFDAVKKTTLTYGASKNQLGIDQSHDMDVFEPSGDTSSNRALILYAHGGFFLFGDKNEAETSGLAKFLGRSGFVLASVNYRLIPQSAKGTEPNVATFARRTLAQKNVVGTIDALADMRGAIRYFLNDADNANTYRIDKENIFVMGYSAGGFTALNLGYINAVNEIPEIEGAGSIASVTSTYTQNYMTANGGIEGSNSSHPSLKTTGLVRAVINIAGALPHQDLIGAGEPPLLNIYGKNDTTIPTERGEPKSTTVASTGVIVSGPKLLKQRATSVGVSVKELVLENTTHDVYKDCNTEKPVYCDAIKQAVRQFITDNMKKK